MILRRENVKNNEAFRKPFILGLLWQFAKYVQNLADQNFVLLKTNSKHPSLHLKKVAKYWSVRIGTKYRAIAVKLEKGLLWLWFWIGTHAEYDKLLN